MNKNQITVLILIVVLFFGGLIGWAVYRSYNLPQPAGPANGGEDATPPQKVLSLNAKVLSVDTENNSLIVESTKDKKEIKIILSENTSLIKVSFPENPTPGATFAPIQTEIDITGFKAGDIVLINSKEDITGKTELNNINFVHILP